MIEKFVQRWEAILLHSLLAVQIIEIPLWVIYLCGWRRAMCIGRCLNLRIRHELNCRRLRRLEQDSICRWLQSRLSRYCLQIYDSTSKKMLCQGRSKQGILRHLQSLLCLLNRRLCIRIHQWQLIVLKCDKWATASQLQALLTSDALQLGLNSDELTDC